MASFYDLNFVKSLTDHNELPVSNGVVRVMLSNGRVIDISEDDFGELTIYAKDGALSIRPHVSNKVSVSVNPHY